MNKLYQCPYNKATKCDLEDGCKGCETFSEYTASNSGYFKFEMPEVETVEKIEQALELAKSKLQVAEQALKDIANWDDDLEYEWGDPGERASDALENIMILGGF